MPEGANSQRPPDPAKLWKQWQEATIDTWKKAAEAGEDPSGLTTQWLEAMKQAQAKFLAGESLPPDPSTFFREWYNATSETWSKAAEDAVGSEQFLELNKRFLESYATFSKAWRHANEEYFRNLQLPTRSDIAGVAELVVALEEKIDRIEDTLDDPKGSQPQGVTIETLKDLEGRLDRVESKLDSILAALEKIQTRESPENVREIDPVPRKPGKKKREPSSGQE